MAKRYSKNVRKSKKRISTKRPRRIPRKTNRKRKTNRTSSTSRISAPGSTCATTIFTVKGHKANPLFAKGQRQLYLSGQNGNFSTGGCGTQGKLPYQIGNTSDLVQMLGSAGPGVTGVLANTNKYLVESMHSEITYSNSSNTTAFLDIYCYQAKRDGLLGVDALWIQGEKDELATSTDYTAVVGNTPDLSNAVKDFWTLKRTYKLVLQPGQCHRHIIHLPINRMLDNEIIRATSQGNTFLKGISHYFEHVLNGTPIGEVAAGTAGTGDGYSSQSLVAIQYNFTEKMVWKTISPLSTGLAINFPHPMINNPVGLAFNPGSGNMVTGIVG